MRRLARMSHKRANEEWARLLAGADAVELRLARRDEPGVMRAGRRKALEALARTGVEALAPLGRAKLMRPLQRDGFWEADGEAREVSGVVFEHGSITLWVLALEPRDEESGWELSVWGLASAASHLAHPGSWDSRPERGGLGLINGSLGYYFEMMEAGFFESAAAEAQSEVLSEATGPGKESGSLRV